MTTQVTDRENIITSLEEAPDRLRAEMGEYYSQLFNPITGEFSNLVTKSFSSGKIRSAQIIPDLTNNQVLIPVKKVTITIEGEEHVFRDHTQWNEYVSQTITEGRRYLDHTFSFTQPSITNQFFKNFHSPQYEDNTKIYPSNQLINFNLISYPHKDDIETIKNIAQIRTRFDELDPEVSDLLSEFPNRITNYTGSVTEISTKQRNIFNLRRGEDQRTLSKFPYFYFQYTDQAVSLNTEFVDKLMEYKKYKNLLQSIKKDLSFTNRSFIVGRTEVSGKIYDIISLLTSTSINRFQESSDELFLLREDDTSHSSPSERFVNQINSVRFLSEMRKFITNESRELEDIYNNQNCQTFLLGYKIEKYIDNDATRPIQTYYSVHNVHIDSQLKYGRKYIYKTKILLGILGSSYSYTNLRAAQGDNEPDAPTTEKYWAEVDVNVQPSFQVLEYEIGNHETAFVDTPMLTPHVSTYGQKNKAEVNFLFQPRFFTLGDFGEEDLPPVGNLRPSDEQIANLYELAGDLRSAPDYFTGTYEIYRLNKSPEKMEDFANGFLTVVDEFMPSGNPDISVPILNSEIDYARFKDRLIPNQKYYYAFRTLTYHSTPSQLTEPIEIELQKDSDEYKISVKTYQYPDKKDYTYEKNAKRLIRIVPNIERLLFSEEVDANTWQLDGDNLVSKGAGPNDNQTFKIRVTSKHTGKKMDLNVTFKLKLDDTFN